MASNLKMAFKKMHLCLIIIQSHPNQSNLPSESKLKCVEEHIRTEASKIDGFDAKSFNILFNEHHKNHKCFVNFETTVQAIQAIKLFENIKIHGCLLKCKYQEPENDTIEINPAIVSTYHKVFFLDF